MTEKCIERAHALANDPKYEDASIEAVLYSLLLQCDFSSIFYTMQYFKDNEDEYPEIKGRING